MNVTVGYTPEKEKEKGDRKSRLASSVLVDQVATLNQDGQEDCYPPRGNLPKPFAETSKHEHLNL